MRSRDKAKDREWLCDEDMAGDDDMMCTMHEKQMMEMMHRHNAHMMPGMSRDVMAMMSMPYFCMHAGPIVEYACCQLRESGVKTAVMEAVFLGMLVGMGYGHEEAHRIVEHWKQC